MFGGKARYIISLVDGFLSVCMAIYHGREKLSKLTIRNDLDALTAMPQKRVEMEVCIAFDYTVTTLQISSLLSILKEFELDVICVLLPN